MTTATSSRTTPAAVEFALLQSWLASGSALQLPLHEIECQQQARGREVQRLLLQAHLQQRGKEMWDPRYASNRRTANCSTPIDGWVPALSSQSLEPSNS